MPMRYDVPLKELLHHFPQRFLQMLTGLQTTDWLNIEYPSVKVRRPDVVARLTDGSILHLELQSAPDPQMLWRMLEYYILIYQHYGVYPLQQVVYIGQATPHFTTHCNTKHLSFYYELIDIRNLDGQLLLESDSLSDNILAILCHLDNYEFTIKNILNKINLLDDKTRKDMLLILGSLANLRNLNTILKQEEQRMSIELSIENNLFVRQIFQKGTQEGLKQGTQQGEIKLLQKMLEKRFGALPLEIKQSLAKASIQQIETWGDRLLDAPTLAEIFSEKSND